MRRGWSFSILFFREYSCSKKGRKKIDINKASIIVLIKTSSFDMSRNTTLKYIIIPRIILTTSIFIISRRSRAASNFNKVHLFLGCNWSGFYYKP